MRRTKSVTKDAQEERADGHNSAWRWDQRAKEIGLNAAQTMTWPYEWGKYSYAKGQKPCEALIESESISTDEANSHFETAHVCVPSVSCNPPHEAHLTFYFCRKRKGTQIWYGDERQLETDPDELCENTPAPRLVVSELKRIFALLVKDAKRTWPMVEARNACERGFRHFALHTLTARKYRRFMRALDALFKEFWGGETWKSKEWANYLKKQEEELERLGFRQRGQHS